MTELEEAGRPRACDIGAEMDVLGGVMFAPEKPLGAVTAALTPESFDDAGHGRIWRAVLELLGQGVAPTMDAVRIKLGGELARVGGKVTQTGGGVATFHGELYLLALTERPVPDVEFFAERVAYLARLRAVGGAASAAATLAGNPNADPADVESALARLAATLGGTGPLHGASARRTWRPVDLAPVLDGTLQTPEPTVGTRDDGRGLFYPGHLHVVAAEAEAGKTWFALAAVAEELTFGRNCVYLDFEDDEGGIVGRLMSMGVSGQNIRDRFAYIRPEESVDDGVNRRDLAEALGDLRPSLAILDGVTEAMGMHGLELKDNTDVASFGRMLPRWIAGLGPAVVTLDHVVKDRENRAGGYAIGGVHKLNGLNGAMYLMENRDPFGIGLTGRSRILVRKDRPGQLRRHGVKAHDGLYWYADLVIESVREDFAEVSLPPPVEQGGAAPPKRPVQLMEAICTALAQVPDGLSGNEVEGAVTGKGTVIRWGLKLLVTEGFVAVESRGQAKIHKLVKPFPDD